MKEQPNYCSCATCFSVREELLSVESLQCCRCQAWPDVASKTTGEPQYCISVLFHSWALGEHHCCVVSGKRRTFTF